MQRDAFQESRRNDAVRPGHRQVASRIRTVRYDSLLLAPASKPSSFGTPGAAKPDLPSPCALHRISSL